MYIYIFFNSWANTADYIKKVGCWNGNDWVKWNKQNETSTPFTLSCTSNEFVVQSSIQEQKFQISLRNNSSQTLDPRINEFGGS